MGSRVPSITNTTTNYILGGTALPPLNNVRQCNSIDAKWLLLKNRLVEGIEKFVPKISKFYEWRKPSWKNPLPRDVREKIRYKHRLRNRYIETRDLEYLTKYKKIEIISVE